MQRGTKAGSLQSGSVLSMTRKRMKGSELHSLTATFTSCHIKEQTARQFQNPEAVSIIQGCSEERSLGLGAMLAGGKRKEDTRHCLSLDILEEETGMVSIRDSIILCMSCVIKIGKFQAYHSTFNVTRLGFEGAEVELTAIQGFGNFTSTAHINSVRNSNFTSPLGFSTETCDSKHIQIGCDKNARCISDHGGAGAWCVCPYGYANNSTLMLPWGTEVLVPAAPKDGQTCIWNNITCPRGQERKALDTRESCRDCPANKAKYTFSNTCHNCPKGAICSGGSVIAARNEGGFFQGQPYLKTCISQDTLAHLKKRNVSFILHDFSRHCSGWTPTTGKGNGTGGTCATWGLESTGTWCYVKEDYRGPLGELAKDSKMYLNRFYGPCKPLIESRASNNSIVLRRVAKNPGQRTPRRTSSPVSNLANRNGKNSSIAHSSYNACQFVVSSEDSLIDKFGGRANIYACPGGTVACASRNRCQPGYMGLGCAWCEDPDPSGRRWAMSAGHVCSPCMSSTSTYRAAALGISLPMLGVMYYSFALHPLLPISSLPFLQYDLNSEEGFTLSNGEWSSRHPQIYQVLSWLKHLYMWLLEHVSLFRDAAKIVQSECMD